MNRSLPLLGLALAVAASSSACTGKYVRPTGPEVVDATPERLERGNYLVNQVLMCGACHTTRVGGGWLGGERTDRYLAGGPTFDDENMKLSTPNITPDKKTGIGSWTDDEIMRAIRDGVHRDGHLLSPPMPFVSGYNVLSDDDTRAVVAYLRSVPPIEREVKRVRELPFGLRFAMKMGMVHHKPARDVKAPPRTDKRAYGEYLARIGICVECHSLTKTGPDDDHLLGGSKMPFKEKDYGKVWARNLTPHKETGLGKYTPDQIKESLKSGRRLDGRPMAPPMSLLIPHISTWNDEDLDALVTFMMSTKPIDFKVPEPELTPAAKALVGP